MGRKNESRDAATAHTAQSATAAWPLIVLTSLTVAVRLVGVGRPLLGNFATKNVVYAMIARNWATGRSSFWQPTLDCLADGERALHLLEVPLSAYLAGALWATLGGSLDMWGRLVSIAFSAAAVAVMFTLVDRWHGRTAAWGASVALALAPVSVIYGQAFMLEASVVFFTLAVVWTFDAHLLTGRMRWLLAASCCGAALLLTKIYMIVLLPALAMMVYRAWGRGVASRTTCSPLILALAALAAMAPAAVWCWHAIAWADPDGATAARVFYSLRDSTRAHGWPHALLVSPGFYLGTLQNLGGVVLTPVGLGLAFIGVAHGSCRRHGPWLASMGLLVLLLPRKFHEMDYYYLVILPPVCLLVGMGWQVVSQRLRPGRVAIAGLLLLVSLLVARYAARPAFLTPAEDQSVMAAASAVRAMSDPEEPVVTVHGSTIDLLYYCDRPGWALSADDTDLPNQLQACRRQGARWLVIAGRHPVDLETAPGMQRTTQADGYCIYRLTGGALAEHDRPGIVDR